MSGGAPCGASTTDPAGASGDAEGAGTTTATSATTSALRPPIAVAISRLLTRPCPVVSSQVCASWACPRRPMPARKLPSPVQPGGRGNVAPRTDPGRGATPTARYAFARLAGNVVSTAGELEGQCAIRYAAKATPSGSLLAAPR